MNLGIAGRRALILGANRGMGLAIAKALHEEGVEIAIAARDEEALAQAAAEIGTARTFRFDLADSPSFPSFAAAVGLVDILINNTGGPPYGNVIDRPIHDWEASFQSMVLSVIKLTDLFLPAMRAAKWGRIITLVSTGAVQPIPVLGISNTLRAGIIAWSKSLATDVAKDGVTVNILMPGRIGTERVALTDAATAEREGIDIEIVRQRSWSQIPMGRYGTPEEIAAVVAFACGTPASYLTGSILRVDGGFVRHV